MKRLLLILFLVGFSNIASSQNLVQTFVDRCTGEVSVFSVPMNGQTVVVFYNKSATFTYAQFVSGEFQAWLEQTYAWWRSISPCSVNQATTTVVQQTTQQATQAATQAASAAASSAATAAASTPPPVLSRVPKVRAVSGLELSEIAEM